MKQKEINKGMEVKKEYIIKKAEGSYVEFNTYGTSSAHNATKFKSKDIALGMLKFIKEDHPDAKLVVIETKLIEEGEE